MADSSIPYAENGTRPVGVFHAHDQDGDAIEWSLSGPDAGLFTIDGGVLAFRHPPNHEEPQSAAAGNLYRVTVEANGGTHDVDVTVIDVDEAGTVSLDRPQPQVSRQLEASLSDEDDGVSARGWQWARSEDRRTWTDIRGAASRRRSPEPADEGMYLRASVTYSDKFGAGKTASAVTSYRVEARTLANAAPSFAGADDDDSTSYVEVGRTVAENSAVGSPVGQAVPAIDADSDILFYELLDTPDQEDNRGEARFTIDSLSGRIRIGKVLGADAGEPEDEDSTLLSGLPQLPSDEDAGDPGNGEYVLRVKVSDPSTASATVNVIVRVTDVNEAPEFAEDAPTLLRVRENVDPPAITFGNGDSPVAADTFAATDQDAGDAPVAYSVTGDDREFFSFDGDILRFIAGHEPDFEEKDSYSITIMARSGEGTRRLSAALDVTVEVVDTENLGEVILSQREPQEGTEVHAVASDPDGGVRVRRWVWERSARITVGGDGTPSAECRDDPDTSLAVVGGWGPVEGAASFAYTPVGADVGRCLRATATYTDNIGDADQQATGVTEAPVQASRSANAAPQFVDPSGRTSRRAAENTEAGRSIGSPVTAFDDDGDLLIYTLGGENAALFGVTRSNGQMLTKSPLNYEVRTRYEVEMIATDPSGASATMLVTVNVIDVDDPALITGRGTIDFAENGTTPAGTFRAIDEAGGTVHVVRGRSRRRPLHHRRRRAALQGTSRLRGPEVRVGGQRLHGDRRGRRGGP